MRGTGVSLARTVAAVWQPWAAGIAARLQEWVGAERGRFVPWLAVFMGAGALLYLSPTEEPPPWAGAAALALGAACWAATRRFMVPRAAALCVFAVAAGFASGQFAAWTALPPEPIPSRAVVLTGTVHAVDVLPEARRITLAAARPGPDAAPLARLVRVRLRENDPAAPTAGDRVRVRALLRPPSPPAYPGAYDPQRDAHFDGLAGSGSALGPLEVLEARAPGGLADWTRRVRDEVNRRVTQGLPGPAGAVSAALLTGNAAAITPEDRAAFRDSGLAHLLSVSGLHVGIVIGLVMGASRFLLALHERVALYWPTKAISAVLGLLCGSLYMALTGVQVPILRSVVMAGLVTLAVVAGRRAVSLRGLALAAIAALLIAPQEVVGASLQMSLSAVLALLAGFEALRPHLDRWRGDGSWTRRAAVYVAALTLTSVLAGSASAPFGAYHFGRVQVYFVLANLVAVPLSGVLVMPAAMAALFLMPLGLEGVALAPLGWGVDALLWIARGVAAWPEAVVDVPHIPAWGLALYTLGFAWLALWRTRACLLGVPVMMAGLLSPVVTAPPDILVAPDARLIAVRADRFYLQSRSGASKVVLQAWQQHLALGDPEPLRAGMAALPCDADTCRIERHGTAVLLLRRDVRLPGCAGAALLVSADPVRQPCPAAPPHVDRFSVWRDGAHAIWLTASGPVVLSDRAHRGERPWVPPPPTPRRKTPTLPMARAEELPPAEADQ